jgi:hypothetical protein
MRSVAAGRVVGAERFALAQREALFMPWSHESRMVRVIAGGRQRAKTNEAARTGQQQKWWRRTKGLAQYGHPCP